MSPDATRRLKLVGLHENQLMALLAATNRMVDGGFPGVIHLPRFTALPVDAQVRGVNYDLTRQCWVVAIEHESFPEVPYGHHIPFDGMAEVQWVEMHPAHVWTCDECGRDNFVRAMRQPIVTISAAAVFLAPTSYPEI